MQKEKLKLFKGSQKRTMKNFLIVFLIVLVFASSCFCLERVPIIKVKADVVIVGDKPEIENVVINQSYVNPIQSPEEADVPFPSVEVWAITNNNQINRAVVEYQGEGTYDLVVGFPGGTGPKDGDFVEIVVKIAGEDGRGIARNSKMIVWGGVNITNATLNRNLDNFSV